MTKFKYLYTMKCLLKEIGSNFKELLESFLSFINSFLLTIWYFFLFITQAIWYCPIFLVFKIMEPSIIKKEEKLREEQIDRLFGKVQKME